MKKFAVLLLALAVFALVCGVAGAEPVTGTCGDNLTWTLDDNGKLTISGTGAMSDDYFSWKYKKEVISVEIGYGVTRIGDSAFSGCFNMISITIPNSVTSIGEHAFDSCESLTSITIPDSVTSIGDSAFVDCRGLKSITIPTSVTSIERCIFEHCENLTSITIPDSVTSIGEYAFVFCSSLESIIIPNSVTSIGASAFAECECLKSVTISHSVTSIESGTFESCKSLKSISIPDSVVSIGACAFQSCESLKSISIPKSLKNIGAYAFWDCDNLINIHIADLESWLSISFEIPDCYPNGRDCHLFIGNTEVTNITIPDSVTSIREHAFFGCENLKSVTISKSVMSIGENAFKYCYDVVIKTPCDSYAATWADANGVDVKKEHIWKDPTYTWAKDKTTVKAKHVCARDASHKETETVKTIYKVTKKPTYFATGVGTYTSKAFTKSKAFKKQTKKVTIAILPRTLITKATIKVIDDQVYTGSAIKPVLTVKFGGKKLVKGTDYAVSFADNIKPGKATVTVTGKNAYKGKATVTFKILPKAIKLVSLKPGKTKLTVTWKKGKEITGYEVEYSTKKNFGTSKTVKVTGVATVKAKITDLKPGKTYYVRVRAYKKVGSKMYYSDWSDKMKATMPEE